MKRTDESIKAAREKYAPMLSMLGGFTVAKLRDIASELGATNIKTKDRGVVASSLARKGELQTALESFLANDNVIITAELSTKQLTEALDKTLVDRELFTDVLQFADAIYQEMLIYLDSLWNGKTQSWEMGDATNVALGIRLYSFLSQPDISGNYYSPYTKLSKLSLVSRYIKRRIEEQKGLNDVSRQKFIALWGYNPDTMKLDKEPPKNSFWWAVSERKQDLIKHVSKDAKKRLEARRKLSKQKRVKLTLDKALSHAYRVLSNTEKDWKWGEISYALALVTGRRQAEIHGIGRFTAIQPSDEIPEELEHVPHSHLIKFEGQLKTTDNRPFVIPTLVPASLVLDGLDELVRLNRRYLDGTPEQVKKLVNSRVSGKLSTDYTPGFFGVFFPELQDIQQEDGDSAVKVLTYHRVREMYALAAIKGFMDEELERQSSKKEFAKLVLGHSKTTEIENYDANFFLDKKSATYVTETGGLK